MSNIEWGTRVQSTLTGVRTDRRSASVISLKPSNTEDVDEDSVSFSGSQRICLRVEHNQGFVGRKCWNL